jgi:hypothetical protein
MLLSYEMTFILILLTGVTRTILLLAYLNVYTFGLLRALRLQSCMITASMMILLPQFVGLVLEGNILQRELTQELFIFGTLKLKSCLELLKVMKAE